MSTINQLSGNPHPNIYRRKNGDTYLKINELLHVKVVLREKSANHGIWTRVGLPEKLDPDEIIDGLIQ